RYVQHVLGVSRATVSRMMQSLETLGFIERWRSAIDRRVKMVKLTKLGRKHFLRANQMFRRSGWAQLAVDCALGDGSLKYRWYDAASCLQATSEVDMILKAFRRNYRDRASLKYPY